MTPSPHRPISVLVADDEEDQCVLVQRILEESDTSEHTVTSVRDGIEALRALREQVFDVAILDLSMPALDGLEVFEAVEGDPQRPQVIFLTGHGTVETATRAMKLGAYDFLEKPVDGDRLATLVWKAAQAREVISRSERHGAAARRQASEVSIVTRDARMSAALGLVARVADSGVSVLVHGESGTGKELIARELHRLSGRAEEPLVALNCAAVAESLAESELFGHEKGAFTGAATKKIGLVELSDGGTLFLDEIGDLEPPLQAKFLRVLETKRFRRLGGVKEFPANFRLVSATNRRLQSLVDEERFRDDLFYRINAVVIELPPLRERRDDIPLLIAHFLDEFRPGEGGSWTVQPDAMELLHRYPWPGNVRELRNVIERVVLLARDRTIRVSDLGPSLTGRFPSTRGLSRSGGEGERDRPAWETGGNDRLPSLNLETLEEIAIERALGRTGWHQGQAADLLGISPRTLHRKIKSMKLERPRGE